MPMLPTQMLWINMVASVALSLPLAFEVLEHNAMQRPPRRPDTPMLGGFVVARTVLVALLMCVGAVGMFWWEYWTEVPRVGHAIALREAQTMTVTTVVFFQVFYLFNCRSLRTSVLALGLFSNRTVFVGIAVLFALQAGFVYLPFMHTVFGSAPLTVEAIARSMLVGAIVLPVISIEKVLWSWHRERDARALGPPANASGRAS
jgi:magnesium-transporting ATPase (P-type)